ncbi:pectinesterase inhibitor 4-like [Humulus lupulus]|uniref:pectinesterase inhibitor 4-like n=1 Tax=Humulus lupulus TaxID=3486 RepID=UPI002B402E41|nr:pectinesterase inhibitor 4-like [Humulus lupulus]
MGSPLTFALSPNFSSCRLLTFFISTLLLLYANKVVIAENHKASSSNACAQTYVANACNSTLYSEDCKKSLMPYATKIESDPKRLCIYSLDVALAAARDAYKTVVKIGKTKELTTADRKVIADCKDNLKGSVEELQQCKNALDSINSSNATSSDEAKFQTDNIKTWASAALTDDTTCGDEIDEEKVGPAMKKKLDASVTLVSRSASILLAIVNGYCSTY